jgi:hypothetical protein
MTNEKRLWFPGTHKIYITRGANWFHSVWLTIWITFLMVFVIMFWGLIVSNTLKFVMAQAKAFMGCFFYLGKHVTYGLLGGLGTRDITVDEFVRGVEERHAELHKQAQATEASKL